jgi:hypothetical protein
MYVGQLRAAGLAKESSVGTLVTPPTEFIPYIAPDSFFPSIGLLESTAIRSLPDKIWLASQGPGEVKNMKLKWEATPENIGNLLMACFGTDTKTGSTAAGYTHTFTRLAAAQLPTYSWWLDKGAKYPQFVGSMLSKLDFTMKAKEFCMVDTEWVAEAYDDTGTSQTPSYNAIAPFKFDMAVINVAGSQVNNYDNVKVTFDNLVKADHVLKGSIWPGKIYSEGFEVTVAMDFFVENSTEYAKFLGATQVALNFVLTHTTDITGANSGTKYTMTIDMPTAMYSVASYPNSNGVIKIAFTARGIYTVASTKTVSVALKNSISSAY